MIIIKLKEAMLRYEREHSVTLTYGDVFNMTGISAETLRSIGSRPGYHCSLGRIETICLALNVDLGDMLEMKADQPKTKQKRKSKAKKKKS